MKKTTSFLAGAAAAVLLLVMGTSALAASGQVSFNFSNIAVDGQTKIAAGTTVTAPNGQQVPGSILYTDGAGGKTNYLPIRAISELLGVEISYDPASKTVRLGKQPAPVTASAGRWQREVNGRDVSYVCGEEGNRYDAPPAWRPTWTPEGWDLMEMRHDAHRNYTARWDYRGSGGEMVFQCAYPSTAGFGRIMNSAEAVESCRKLTVQGYEADYYQDGKTGVLVWENGEGILFFLSGTNATQDQMTRVAESVKPCTASVEEYALGRLPKGYTLMDRYAIADTVQEYWVRDNVALSWAYSAVPLGLPGGEGTAVDLDGTEARFWEAEEPYAESEGTAGGAAVFTVPAQKNLNTLAWRDAERGVYCRLQSVLDKEAMVAIAQSMD